MFRKKTKAFHLPNPKDLVTGSPWDPDSIDTLLKANKFELHITHVEDRFRSMPGSGSGHSDFIETDVIATGYLKTIGYRQLVHVEVTFDDNETFGSTHTGYNQDVEYYDAEVNVPTLSVVLRDSNGSIQSKLVEAMKAAAVCGDLHVSVRLEVSEPELIEHDYGPTLHHKITRFYLWSELHSPNVKSWQLPIADIRFSLAEVKARLLRKKIE